MSTPASSRAAIAANAGREFARTATLLLVVVTIIRGRTSPTSPLTIGSMPVLSATAGLLVAILIAALMYSRLGRRSGGHMHAGVSVFVWLNRAFPAPLRSRTSWGSWHAQSLAPH